MKRGPATILFTCRDAGAAHNIKELVPAFARVGYKAVLAASDAAIPVLKERGLKPAVFKAAGNGGRELLDKTRLLLLSVKPSAVFCGLTTQGYGIDEGVLYWASPQRMDIPSFQYLDSWGTFNTFGGSAPSVYFAMDKDSVRLGKRSKALIVVTGSPKYAAYSSKPIIAIRKRVRKELGISEGGRLVGYFGQQPSVPGHMLNFRMLVRAFRDLSAGGRFLMRPHPAFMDEYGPYREYLRKEKVPYIDGAKCREVENLLCACDVVATCYSTSAVDHSYLSCYSKAPIGACVYLLAGRGIKNYLREKFGYYRNPLLERGIGYHAEDAAETGKIIAGLLEGKVLAKKYFEATKGLRVKGPCEKIVNYVSGRIREKYGC